MRIPHPLFLPLILALGCLPNIQAKFQSVETCDTIQIQHSGQVLLEYLKKPAKAPEGINPDYERSGYIHPLRTLSGKPVTGDFEADHPHQHALFFAWRKCEFEGRALNFWEHHSGKGKISHNKTLELKDGGFSVELLWTDETKAGKSKPVLIETWTIRPKERTAGGWLLDLESTQRCASKSPLKILKYHYGGFAIRGPWFTSESENLSKAWLKAKDGSQPPAIAQLSRDFLTSEGKHWHDGNHTQPNWVSMFGKDAAVTLFSHPDNFRAPQHVRLHPHKPYFCFAPIVPGEFQIKPGKPYVSKFRFFIQDGQPAKGNLDKIWKDWTK